MTDELATPPPQQPPKPIKLPPLRSGLDFSFSDYDLDGKPQWMIHDAGRNKFFIIGWLEYELLQRWNLGTVEALIESVNRETTLDVGMPDIEGMVRFLKNNFLLKQTGYDIGRSAEEQQLFKNDNILHWLVTYYLFFRIPLVHPDKFLDRTKAIGEFLFNRYFAYFMWFLGIIALYQISVQWEDFNHTFSTLISLQGLILYMIVFVACKCCHELGHAYMTKHYGVAVPTLGVAFLVFWPVLYTDTTLSWSLNSKQRMRIALAGMWIETYIAIIAALIWANVHNPTVQAVCYLVVGVNWVASLLINVSPFMRFDGYYVLSDFLRMPNLQPRAFALTRWQVRKWMWGWSDPAPEKFSPFLHRLLVAYSIFTWVYRLTIYIGIAVLVYHFFIKLLGIVLFGIELFYFILRPFVQEAEYWYKAREKFVWNISTIVTTSIAAIAVLSFFVPFNESVQLPATISYYHRFLVAPEEGVIATDIPRIDSPVAANQPIITIDSDVLNHNLVQTYLEYSKSMQELRRASVNDTFSRQKEILISTVSKEVAKYNKLHELLTTLTISVPFNGKIIEIAPNLRKGNIVMKNEWLGDVIQPDNARVEAYSPQRDLNLIDQGLEGYFYPHDISLPAMKVRVAVIELLNSNELNCNIAPEVKQNKSQDENLFVGTPCYSASDLGGEIPTYSTDDGKFVPVESIYRVILTTPDKPEITQVQRGNVVLKTEPRSYAYRLFYSIKKIIIQQSGF